MTAAFVPRYSAVQVQQKHRETGCIPTAVEWLLRYHGDTSCLDQFQDLCDLDKGKVRDRNVFMNDFGSITREAHAKGFGSRMRFRIEGVDPLPELTGVAKVARIRQLVDAGNPPVIPFRNADGFHAVPVVGYDDARCEFTVVLMRGVCRASRLPYACVRDQQDRRQGGQDILYVENVLASGNSNG